ncbi:hypothetical protein V2H77_00090, partial [Photorhabdus sp. P32]|uniref:LuxE/PaaK family acyltransferase n=1 Tax=Photorhabdus sp. P32 TaxID=3117549 RepID=UPI00328B4163
MTGIKEYDGSAAILSNIILRSKTGMTSYVDKQEITASSEIDDLIFSSDPLIWSYDEQEKIRKKLVLDAFRHHYKHCREY